MAVQASQYIEDNMALKDNLEKAARTLLTRYGETATFDRTLEGAYDPTTGSVGIGASTSFQANVYPSQYSALEVDGNTITTEDTRLVVSSTVEPEIGDTATFNSHTYRVLNKQQISVSGENVLYILQVRY